MSRLDTLLAALERHIRRVIALQTDLNTLAEPNGKNLSSFHKRPWQRGLLRVFKNSPKGQRVVVSTYNLTVNSPDTLPSAHDQFRFQDCLSELKIALDNTQDAINALLAPLCAGPSFAVLRKGLCITFQQDPRETLLSINFQASGIAPGQNQGASFPLHEDFNAAFTCFKRLCEAIHSTPGMGEGPTWIVQSPLETHKALIEACVQAKTDEAALVMACMTQSDLLYTHCTSLSSLKIWQEAALPKMPLLAALSLENPTTPVLGLPYADF